MGILGLFFALRLSDFDTPLRLPFQLEFVGLLGISGMACVEDEGNLTSCASPEGKGSVWRNVCSVATLILEILLELAIESFAEWLLTLEFSLEMMLELVVKRFLCSLNVLDRLRDSVRVDIDDDPDDLGSIRIGEGRRRVCLT